MKHAKSSAMLVSLAIHGILIAIAVTFVAVSVKISKETEFIPPPCLIPHGCDYLPVPLLEIF